MLFIRGPDDVHRIDRHAIRQLVEQRWAEILDGQPYDSDTHGEMIVVIPGDTATALEEQSGCPIVTNPFDQSRFPDPDFVPLCETIQEHPSCYEMVFILNDEGFGVTIFVPKSPGIDAELLSLCQQFAEPAIDPAGV